MPGSRIIGVIKTGINSWYKGEVLDGKPHGIGTHYQSDGNCYKGVWEKGKIKEIYKLIGVIFEVPFLLGTKIRLVDGNTYYVKKEYKEYINNKLAHVLVLKKVGGNNHGC